MQVHYILLPCRTNKANNIQEHSMVLIILPTPYAILCTLCRRRAHAYLLTLVFSTFSPAHDDNDDADNQHH